MVKFNRSLLSLMKLLSLWSYKKPSLFWLFDFSVAFSATPPLSSSYFNGAPCMKLNVAGNEVHKVLFDGFLHHHPPHKFPVITAWLSRMRVSVLLYWSLRHGMAMTVYDNWKYIQIHVKVRINVYIYIYIYIFSHRVVLYIEFIL